MDRQAIQLISHIFIIGGIVLFVSAVMLAILKHKERTAHILTLNLNHREAPAFKNRRQHERMPFEHEVRFSHQEAPYEEGTAKGRDISLGGTGLYVPVNVKVRPGARLDLELPLEEEEKPMKVVAEVVWTESLEDEKMEQLSMISEFFARRIGLKFLDIDEDEKQRIQIFVGGFSERLQSPGGSN